MAEGRDNRIFLVIAGIVVLSVGGIAGTIYISESNDVSDGYIPIDEREGWNGEGADAGAEADEGEPEARRQPREDSPAGGSGAPAYDENELAQVLLDGGRPPSLIETKAVRIGPTSPERALSRAHVMQGLLETRIDQLTRQRDEAQAAGNESRARLMQRQIDRLTPQRDPLERHIESLDEAVEDAEAEATDEEEPSEVASPE